MLKVKIEFLAILELFGQDRRDFVFLKGCVITNEML